MGKSLMSCFFDSQCSTALASHLAGKNASAGKN